MFPLSNGRFVLTDALPFAGLVLAALAHVLVRRRFTVTDATTLTATRAVLFHVWGLMMLLDISAFAQHGKWESLTTLLRESLVMVTTLGLIRFTVLCGRPRGRFYFVVVLALSLAELAVLLRLSVSSGLGSALILIFPMMLLQVATHLLYERRPSRTQVMLRSLLYGLSTFSILVWIFPRLVLGGWAEFFLHTAADIRLSPLAPLSLLLLLPALWIFLCCAWLMAAHSGTPDPADPPNSLIIQGIYARLRHPLHLAEILLAWSCLLLLDSPAVSLRPLVLYALGLSAIILGPWRLLEEMILVQRFGKQAENYIQRVPAYGWGTLK